MNKIIIPLAALFLAAFSISSAGRPTRVSAMPPSLGTDPGLATAANYSVLGFSTVTNTGTSNLAGSIGVWSGTAISNVGTLNIGGATEAGTLNAQIAQADALTADNNILGQTPDGSLLPELNSQNIVPGVYDIGAATLTGGTLTLNGQGFYIFRTSSTLVSSGNVALVNGARACDVYWHVETAATINGSSFVGTIIAKSGIHFGDSVTLDGRALAIGADVTLISDNFTGPSCPPLSPTAVPTGTATAVPGSTPAPVIGLPDTGGAPLKKDEFPWGLAVILGGLGAFVLGIGLKGRLRMVLPRQ